MPLTSKANKHDVEPRLSMVASLKVETRHMHSAPSRIQPVFGNFSVLENEVYKTIVPTTDSIANIQRDD